MKCPKCQSDNPDTLKFCGECGTQLIPSEEISAPTQTLETPKEELTAGFTFAGRYEIIEVIGRGGMGLVYKAKDNKLKRTVALKFLSSDLARDTEAKERFMREAQAAAVLDHSNICTVHEIDEAEGKTFISMAYVEGQSLKEKIKSGPLEINKVLDIAIQVAEGLEEAHKKGIVHRDIKSSNIIVTGKGQAKIMDFGLARIVGGFLITKEATIMGTVAYMSPEQASGEAVDQRTDIWSFGVVMYEMLSGQLPFKGEHETSIMYSIIHEEPKPLKDIKPDIATELEQIVRKALTKNLQDRYQNMEDLIDDLNSISKGFVPPKIKAAIRRARVARIKRAYLYGGIVGLFVLLIAAGLYFFALRGKTIASIAVLPFVNVSGDHETEILSDGITETLINKLAQLPKLKKVISRESVFAYKGQKIDPKRVGQELDVKAVLTSRMIQHGDELRVSVALVNTSDSSHIWGEKYSQKLEDIFIFEEEMATAIMQALRLKLTGEEKRRLTKRYTENLEAYQAYLRGVDYLERPSVLEEDLRMAVQMFERAVRLDPKFALAYAELSYAHSLLYHYGYDPTEERQTKVKAAADQALELQPALPNAHLALGNYYYRCRKEYNRALEEFIIAEKDLPNDTRLLSYIAAIRRRQGRFEEVVRIFKRAFELNPKDAQLAMELGNTFMFLRRYPEAERFYERSISLAPDQLLAYWFKAMNYWLWEGATEKARTTLEEIPKKDYPVSIYFWHQQELMERNYQLALDRLSSVSTESFKWQTRFIPKSQLEGFVYLLLNKPELARASFNSARIILEREAKERPGDPNIHSSLGFVYAALGRKEAAIHEGKLATELLPVSKDAFIGSDRVKALARIYVMVGEHDAALDQIEYLLSMPSFLSIPALQLDPVWDPLREHPRFQHLTKDKLRK